MKEHEPFYEAKGHLLADTIQFQEDLNVFRSRITAKLDDHRAINSRGIGLALFERRIEHADELRPSVYQAMIYQLRTVDQVDNLAYDKPIIKLLVNDGIITPRGPRFIVTDITIDHEDDVLVMVNAFDDEYPDFPESDMFLPPSQQDGGDRSRLHETQGVLFDVKEGDIVFSENFKYYPQQVGINPKLFGYDRSEIFPFGDYQWLYDRIDGVRMANEILDTIGDIEPYFIKT